jgi:hypothetical protein
MRAGTGNPLSAISHSASLRLLSHVPATREVDFQLHLSVHEEIRKVLDCKRR